MPEEDQAKVWDLIDAWADSKADERAKADLGEWIRRFVFTRFGRLRGLNDATKNRARVAYKKLEPTRSYYPALLAFCPTLYKSFRRRERG